MRGVLLLLAAAACAEERNISPHRVLTLAPGDFVEAEVVLAEGDEVSIDFVSDALVDWNIHRHDGDAVVTLLDETGQNVAYTFTASVAATHWVMFANPGDAPARLDVTVTADGFVGW